MNGSRTGVFATLKIMHTTQKRSDFQNFYYCRYQNITKRCRCMRTFVLFISTHFVASVATTEPNASKCDRENKPRENVTKYYHAANQCLEIHEQNPHTEPYVTHVNEQSGHGTLRCDMVHRTNVPDDDGLAD